MPYPSFRVADPGAPPCSRSHPLLTAAVARFTLLLEGTSCSISSTSPLHSASSRSCSHTFGAVRRWGARTRIRRGVHEYRDYHRGTRVARRVRLPDLHTASSREVLRGM